MGYYLNSGEAHGKAEWLVKEHGGKIVNKTEAQLAVSNPSLAAVIVINNGPFEAAGFAYDMDEFEAFTEPQDIRSLDWTHFPARHKKGQLVGVLNCVE